MSADSILAAGAQALQLDLPAQARQKLLAYVALLHKWNQVYNLTAVREPQEMLSHHVLDSLAVVSHIRGTRILDVGSGGGLPGIPLAIACPNATVTLLDSSHKKTTFLRQAVIELDLQNVEVVCERLEAWKTTRVFDVVISRAFAELQQFVAAAAPLCASTGMLAAMKGVHPYEELAQLPAGYEVREVVPLIVPGLRARRHLVLIGHCVRHEQENTWPAS
ncbi:MAG TPA: 16S rRNA (guanine(527)-N(7))-methyltransferase RsmG [Burkholderiales bacterium]|nr:16S rRNA (guanine(527)-N(7))-methyltransferase RsmG [Burkholderiales bacterium]